MTARFKPTRELYIPKGYTEIKDAQSEAVAYVSTSGKPCAMGFGGKRAKPDYNYIFRSEAARDEHVQKHFSAQRERAVYKEEQRAARNQATTLRVGDILVNSWGYDQTNVDFYQVVEVKPSGKSVVIRSISSEIVETGFMCGERTPILDSFHGDEIIKRSTSDYVSFDYGSGNKWNGKPQYVSWYA